MPKPPPDYEGAEKGQWVENANDVARRVNENDKFLIRRIKLFVSRFRYSESEVERKIRKDCMFAAHFAKEPRRQGMHEKMASEWIKSLDNVNGFQTLPKSGSGAFHVTSDGEIRHNMSSSPSKSLDFKWTTRRTTFYASHKYTKEGGGNQDSQFKEVRLLLEHFQKGAVRDTILMVIVDGAYYTNKKMDDLERFTRSSVPYSYALHIEDVPKILERHA